MPEAEHEYRVLQESEERLRAFMHHSPVLAFMKDEDGRYVYVNPRMEDTFQIKLADIQGKADADWLPDSVARTVRKNDMLVLTTGRTIETVETVPTSDGTLHHLMVLKFPFTSADGQKLVGGVAFDITVLKQTEERLIESERRYRRLFEGSLGLLCTHDLNGHLLSVNPAAAHALGYEANQLVGKDFRDVLTPQLRDQFDVYLERVRQNGTDHGLFFVVGRDGEPRTWKYHNALVSEGGRPDYVLGHAQDVTELRQAQETSQNLSLTDDLSGLYNRRGFLTLATQQLRLSRARRTEKSLLLVYADLDGLKQINDRFGHQAGNLAIVKVAEALKATFRHSDITARIGGDEFVVLMINATEDGGELMCERLQERLRAYNAQDRLQFNVTISIGTSAVDSEGSASVEEMLLKADEAMYRQKRSKRGGP